eukprot:437527_1
MGKTIEIAAYLSALFHSEIANCVLLVAETSLLHNWQRELRKWCQHVDVRLYHTGSRVKREKALYEIKEFGGILLTTYGMVTSKQQILASAFEDGWDYFILDEGHKIRNTSTKISQAVRKIPTNGGHRIILSGTAFQNNLPELWSVFDFVSDGKLLGRLAHFKVEYVAPIKRSNEKCASESEKAHGQQLAKQLQQKIRPYFLRRTKDVYLVRTPRQKDAEASRVPRTTGAHASIGRPGKAPVAKIECRKGDFIVWVKMNEIQIRMYRQFLSSKAVGDVLLQIKKSPLMAITMLKNICDSPRLLDRGMVNCGELDFEGVHSDNLPATMLRVSAKLELAEKLAVHLTNAGHKTLIFSLSKKILNMLEQVLVPHSIRFVRLDGDVKFKDRPKIIEQFNTDASVQVMLLTTLVGGLGLNLVGADRVIIFDPSWNPSIDSQAVDRAYRLGQTKDVVVFRLMTCGTIEEKIYRRQVSKIGLIKKVTQGSALSHFTRAELREVFILEDPTKSHTFDLFGNDHHVKIENIDSLKGDLDFVNGHDKVLGASDHETIFSESAAMKMLEWNRKKQGRNMKEEKTGASMPAVASMPLSPPIQIPPLEPGSQSSMDFDQLPMLPKVILLPPPPLKSPLREHVSSPGLNISKSEFSGNFENCPPPNSSPNQSQKPRKPAMSDLRVSTVEMDTESDREEGERVKPGKEEADGFESVFSQPGSEPLSPIQRNNNMDDAPIELNKSMGDLNISANFSFDCAPKSSEGGVRDDDLPRQNRRQEADLHRSFSAMNISLDEQPIDSEPATSSNQPSIASTGIDALFESSQQCSSQHIYSPVGSSPQSIHSPAAIHVPKRPFSSPNVQFHECQSPVKRSKSQPMAIVSEQQSSSSMNISGQECSSNMDTSEPSSSSLRLNNISVSKRSPSTGLFTDPSRSMDTSEVPCSPAVLLSQPPCLDKIGPPSEMNFKSSLSTSSPPSFINRAQAPIESPMRSSPSTATKVFRDIKSVSKHRSASRRRLSAVSADPKGRAQTAPKRFRRKRRRPRMSLIGPPTDIPPELRVNSNSPSMSASGRKYRPPRLSALKAPPPISPSAHRSESEHKSPEQSQPSESTNHVHHHVDETVKLNHSSIKNGHSQLNLSAIAIPETVQKPRPQNRSVLRSQTVPKGHKKSICESPIRNPSVSHNSSLLLSPSDEKKDEVYRMVVLKMELSRGEKMYTIKQTGRTLYSAYQRGSNAPREDVVEMDSVEECSQELQMVVEEKIAKGYSIDSDETCPTEVAVVFTPQGPVTPTGPDFPDTPERDIFTITRRLDFSPLDEEETSKSFRYRSRSTASYPEREQAPCPKSAKRDLYGTSMENATSAPAQTSATLPDARTRPVQDSHKRLEVQSEYATSNPGERQSLNRSRQSVLREPTDSGQHSTNSVDRRCQSTLTHDSTASSVTQIEESVSVCPRISEMSNVTYETAQNSECESAASSVCPPKRESDVVMHPKHIQNVESSTSSCHPIESHDVSCSSNEAVGISRVSNSRGDQQSVISANISFQRTFEPSTQHETSQQSIPARSNSTPQVTEPLHEHSFSREPSTVCPPTQILGSLPSHSISREPSVHRTTSTVSNSIPQVSDSLPRRSFSRDTSISREHKTVCPPTQILEPLPSHSISRDPSVHRETSTASNSTPQITGSLPRHSFSRETSISREQSTICQPTQILQSPPSHSFSRETSISREQSTIFQPTQILQSPPSHSFSRETSISREQSTTCQPTQIIESPPSHSFSRDPSLHRTASTASNYIPQVTVSLPRHSFSRDPSIHPEQITVTTPSQNEPTPKRSISRDTSIPREPNSIFTPQIERSVSLSCIFGSADSRIKQAELSVNKPLHQLSDDVVMGVGEMNTTMELGTTDTNTSRVIQDAESGIPGGSLLSHVSGSPAIESNCDIANNSDIDMDVSTDFEESLSVPTSDKSIVTAQPTVGSQP